MTVVLHPRPADALTAEELARWRAVPVAVAVDVCGPGCQIDPAIRPLCPPGQQPRLFGRAVTALCTPPDFGAVLYALDQIEAGDVLVIAAGGERHTAMIGEILGGQLRRRGGVGIVCDGAIRDVAQLAAWPDLAVFCRWITPRGPLTLERGVVNASVAVGGAVVSPGDLLLGDDDGLVALSSAAARAGIAAAGAKLAREAAWQASLASGHTMAATFGLAAPELSTDYADYTD